MQALMVARDMVWERDDRPLALALWLKDTRKIIELALEADWDHARARALSDLASSLAALPLTSLAHLWLEDQKGGNLLHALARRPRRDLLSDIRTLAPVIAALGGPEAVAETVRAIQDVGRWWP
jgi:hypothetical protein